MGGAHPPAGLKPHCALDVCFSRAVSPTPGGCWAEAGGAVLPPTPAAGPPSEAGAAPRLLLSSLCHPVPRSPELWREGKQFPECWVTKPPEGKNNEVLASSLGALTTHQAPC